MNSNVSKTTAPTNNTNGSDICRMSWFLIKVDREENSNAAPAYSIIHSVDLVENEASNIYLNRSIKFKRNQTIQQGNIIAASDDKAYMEAQLKQLEGSQVPPDMTHSQQYFLVQYKNMQEKLTHAVVHYGDICWSEKTQPAEVVVADGSVKQLAVVLHIEATEDKMHIELQKLKTLLYETAFDESDEDIKIPDDTWLLVQYYSSTNNLTKVMHDIVHFRETVWKETNQFKDVVAYLSDGTTIYQSVIIRKSHDRQELQQFLVKLKNAYQLLRFPLPDILVNTSLPTKDKQTTFPVATPKQQEQPNANRELELMEQQMQNEANTLADAFSAIAHVLPSMELRLQILNNL